MSKRRRVVLAIILGELLLGGLWFYLNDMALNSPNATADSTRVIGEMLGMAMGALLGFGLLLFLIAHKNDAASRREK